MSLPIATMRLRAQGLLDQTIDRPANLVRWMGAVQAQDYAGGLWGIALRTNTTRSEVERAVETRTIVRTWPMRGTLHFVPAEDARWMVRLLAPRVIARAASRHRQLELDARTFAKAEKHLVKALDGGKSLTRPEAYAEMARGGVDPRGQRGIHVLAHLAMRGVLCFGARRGNQPTFVLFDEWIRTSRTPSDDEALAELARRYFSSHGPATASDFAWWTGLSLGEARRAIDIAGDALERHVEQKSTYFMADSSSRAPRRAFTVHLLPPYDEYTVAYRDRSAVLDAAHAQATRNGIFSPVVLVDGRVAGTWRRTVRGGDVHIATELLVSETKRTRKALDEEIARYRAFWR